MKPAPRAPSSISKLDQHDLALQAVRAAKKDENGFATTGDTYETYLDLPTPPPYVHIGERHFRDPLRDLGIQGRLELHHVSRGRHGATTFIREKPRPPLRTDAHAES